MSSVRSRDASPNQFFCFYHVKFGKEATRCKPLPNGQECDFKKLGEEPKCGWCGKEKHEKSQCPARDKTCHNCQKLGHFGAVCRNDCNLCGGEDHERSKCPDHVPNPSTHPFAFCCAFCGGEKHEKSQCPATDETCRKCLKIGHFGNVCLSAGSGKKQLPDLRTHLKNNQGERQPGDLRERLSRPRQRNRENLDSEDLGHLPTLVVSNDEIDIYSERRFKHVPELEEEDPNFGEILSENYDEFHQEDNFDQDEYRGPSRLGRDYSRERFPRERSPRERSPRERSPRERSPRLRGRSPTPIYYDNAVDFDPALTRTVSNDHHETNQPDRRYRHNFVNDIHFDRHLDDFVGDRNHQPPSQDNHYEHNDFHPRSRHNSDYFPNDGHSGQLHGQHGDLRPSRNEDQNIDENLYRLYSTEFVQEEQSQFRQENISYDNFEKSRSRSNKDGRSERAASYRDRLNHKNNEDRNRDENLYSRYSTQIVQEDPSEFRKKNKRYRPKTDDQIKREVQRGRIRAAKHGDRLNLEDRQSYENDPHHEKDSASVCIGSYDDKCEDNDGNVFLPNDSEMVVLDEIHEEPEEEPEEEVIFQVTNENPATSFLATLSLPKPAPTRSISGPEEEMNAIAKMKNEYEEKLKLKLSGVEPAGPAKDSPYVQPLHDSDRALTNELKSYESNEFNENDNDDSVNRTGNGTSMPPIRRRKPGKREREGTNICTYHEKFGAKARNCKGDCDFLKIGEETSPAGEKKTLVTPTLFNDFMVGRDSTSQLPREREKNKKIFEERELENKKQLPKYIRRRSPKDVKGRVKSSRLSPEVKRGRTERQYRSRSPLRLPPPFSPLAAATSRRPPSLSPLAVARDSPPRRSFSPNLPRFDIHERPEVVSFQPEMIPSRRSFSPVQRHPMRYEEGYSYTERSPRERSPRERSPRERSPRERSPREISSRERGFPIGRNHSPPNSSRRSLSPPKSQRRNNSRPASPMWHHMEAAKPGCCPCCNSNLHQLENCQTFLEWNVSKRWALVNKFANVCSICLANGHNHNVCGKYTLKCMIEGCEMSHHSLLHDDSNLFTKKSVDLVNDEDETNNLKAAITVACAICESMNHLLQDCPDIFCHKCKRSGHFPKDCQGKSRQICQYCKMPGHSIAICPIVLCRKCGRQGHTDLTCTAVPGKVEKIEKPINCFECGVPGHLSKDCPNGFCTKCKQNGHVAKNCTKPVECHNCGMTGEQHFFFQILLLL